MDGGIAALPGPSNNDDALVFVPRGAVGLGAVERPGAHAIGSSGRKTLA